GTWSLRARMLPGAAGSGIPVLDQGAGNGQRRRHDRPATGVLAPGQGLADFLAAEPARILQLAVGARQVGLAFGDVAKHQRAGERPGLGCQVLAAAHPHPGFLVDLAHHRLLRRLAGLDEAGQHRPAARDPAGLAAQQQALAVADGDDHRRVDARIVVGAAARAMADEATTLEPEAFAANAAMPAAGTPVRSEEHTSELQSRENLV